MGVLSVAVWRTIYDTLRKQRGDEAAAETPLGDMFTLLDEYSRTMEKVHAENAELRAALKALVCAKYEKSQHGDNPVYQLLKKAAWEKARAVLGGEK